MSIVYHYDASYLEIDVKWMIDEKCKLGEMFMIFLYVSPMEVWGRLPNAKIIFEAPRGVICTKCC